jgi:capsular polysaccharide biosynthesis protein
MYAGRGTICAIFPHSSPIPNEVGVLDLKTLLFAVRRHKAIFGVLFMLGLVIGIAFTVIKPPLLASKVLVVIPGTRYIQTQAVIAASDPVLLGAARNLHPVLPLETLRHLVKVTTVTSTVLSITALGKTASQAQETVNAVADSYVDFVQSPKSPGGKTTAEVLENATPAIGPTLPVRATETGGLGGLAGALIGIIVVGAIGRTDRRLRERDEIAAAIGAPVLASLPVAHPSDPGGWARLLASYEPTITHAWSMRKALRQLGLTEGRSVGQPRVSVAIVSLSSDRRALALGPQLATFAATLGIPTKLVVGQQQESGYTAALSAACTMTSTALSDQSNRLQFATDSSDESDRYAPAALTVIVEVVDSREPRFSHRSRASATVLGVTAGAATAEQLARVAVSVAADGRDITGALVANPLPSDRTTGSLPQFSQSQRRRGPAHTKQQHGRGSGNAVETQR